MKQADRITNKDGFELLKNRNRYQLTTEFFSTHDRPSDEYLKMYKQFVDNDFKGNKDNESFYKALIAWKIGKIDSSHPIPIYSKEDFNSPLGIISEISQLSLLDKFHDLDINILQPDQNIGGPANQKWHLFIAVFAYNLICGVNPNGKWNLQAPDEYWGQPFLKYWKKTNWQDYPSRFLKLWVVDNLTSDEGLNSAVTVNTELYQIYTNLIEANKSSKSHTVILINNSFKSLERLTNTQIADT